MSVLYPSTALSSTHISCMTSSQSFLFQTLMTGPVAEALINQRKRDLSPSFLSHLHAQTSYQNLVEIWELFDCESVDSMYFGL